jgi:hypothetical protein
MSTSAPATPVACLARAAAVLLLVASFAHVWSANRADEDLWTHVSFGGVELGTRDLPRVDHWSYSADGRPFFDHEWLADATFALAFAWGGGAALLALKLLVGLVVVGCALDAARTLARGALDPTTVAAALVLALAAMAPGASLRPQLFTMAFLAIEWALLERADRAVAAGRPPRALAAMPALLLVWTNMHGGFLVGVGLMGMFVVATVGRAPGRRAAALVAGAGVATVAVTLANPYGPALHRYLLHTLGSHGRITEWAPVAPLSLDHLRFKALVAATAAVVLPWWWTERRTLDWRVGFLAVAAILGFRHQRHTVLFAIAAAPVLTVAAERARRTLVARHPALAPRARVVVVAALGAGAIALVQLAEVGSRLARDGLVVRYARAEFPADAVAFLRANGVGGNMAVQFEWGGYTRQHLGEAARVFIDGRFEAVYPPQVMDDYFAFVDGAPGWERVLDAYPTDVVMLEPDAPVVPLLARRPDLIRVYADQTAVVWMRRAAATPTAVVRRDADPDDPVFP